MTKIRKKIGTIPINDIEQQVQQSTKAAVTQMQQNVTDFINEETAQYPEIGEAFKFQEDPEGRSEITTDSESKIISYRKADGTKVENVGIEAESLNLSRKNTEEIVGKIDMLDVGIRYDFRLPVVKVYSSNIKVSGNELIGLTIYKNEVSCEIQVITPEQKFIDKNAIIAYQGNSTLLNPKKGFTLDFSKKHRLKDWLSFDSFHCKAYFTNFKHYNDWLANQIIEQAYNSRNISERRPFMKYNDFANDSVNMLVEGGALCHTDEFPVELYINNNYWGLYSFRIKKSRDNYLLSKKNLHHIQVEAANDAQYTDEWFEDGGIGWGKNEDNVEYIEIRNPTGDSGNSKFKAGTEPADGEIKRAWKRFISRLNSVTASTTVEELEEFLDIQEWIDAILLYNFIGTHDCWCKNTLYTSWDSSVDLTNNIVTGHWSPLLYDFDNAFPNEEASDVGNSKAYRNCPWLRIIQTILKDKTDQRYKELRDNGIFDYENIKKLVTSITKEIGYDVYKDDRNRWDYPSSFLSGIEDTLESVTKKIPYMDDRFNYNI